MWMRQLIIRNGRLFLVLIQDSRRIKDSASGMTAPSAVLSKMQKIRSAWRRASAILAATASRKSSLYAERYIFGEPCKRMYSVRGSPMRGISTIGAGSACTKLTEYWSISASASLQNQLTWRGSHATAVIRNGRILLCAFSLSEVNLRNHQPAIAIFEHLWPKYDEKLR